MVSVRNPNMPDKNPVMKEPMPPEPDDCCSLSICCCFSGEIPNFCAMDWRMAVYFLVTCCSSLSLSSAILEICQLVKKITRPKKATKIKMLSSMARPWGTFFFCSHFTTGSSSMASRAAKVNGTKKGFPYTMITTARTMMSKANAGLPLPALKTHSFLPSSVVCWNWCRLWATSPAHFSL